MNVDRITCIKLNLIKYGLFFFGTLTKSLSSSPCPGQEDKLPINASCYFSEVKIKTLFWPEEWSPQLPRYFGLSSFSMMTLSRTHYYNLTNVCVCVWAPKAKGSCKRLQTAHLRAVLLSLVEPQGLSVCESERSVTSDLKTLSCPT